MLTNKEIQIYGPLQKLKILYEGFPHPPIVTLDEGLALAETMKAVAVKDLLGRHPKRSCSSCFSLLKESSLQEKPFKKRLEQDILLLEIKR